MGVKEMVVRAEEEIGCNWCRFMVLKHSGHIGYCSAWQRNTILKKLESCPRFLRALNADQLYRVFLTEKVSVAFSGRHLNCTGILPDTLISSDQFYRLLRVASYSGPVNLTAGTHPVVHHPFGG